MKSIPAVFFILCGLFSTGFAIVSPSDAPGEEALEQIREAMEDIHSLAGDFIEEKRLVMLKEPVLLKGRFFYVKPDRLRWEYFSPEAQGFALSKDRGIRWQKNPNQRIPFDLNAAPALQGFVDQIFSWIQGDVEKIQNRYRVSVSSEDAVFILLTPRIPAEKAVLDRILIRFSHDLRYVRTVHIHEKNGDTSRIRFTHVRINPPVDSKLFP